MESGTKAETEMGHGNQRGKLQCDMGNSGETIKGLMRNRTWL